MNVPTRAQRLPAEGLLGVAELLRELALPDEAAELRMLIDLCRRSLRVRAWLFGRFAREPATQAAFRMFLANPEAGLPNRALWPRALTMAMAPDLGRSGPGEGAHGGLSEVQILALIKGYQANYLDVTAFVLARLWRRFLRSDRKEVPLALQLASARHWGALANDDSGRCINRLSDVLRFFRERCCRTIGDGDFGHPNSWRIHVLVHILDHPRPCYRVDELYRSLPPKYRHVDRREVRDFCRRHGIRRDRSPGRPSTSLRKQRKSPGSKGRPLR